MFIYGGLLSSEKRVSLETSGITIPEGHQNLLDSEVRETTIGERG